MTNRKDVAVAMYLLSRIQKNGHIDPALDVANRFSTIDENSGLRTIIIEHVLVNNIAISISRHSHPGSSWTNLPGYTHPAFGPYDHEMPCARI